MRVGDLDITPVSDGQFVAPPEFFGPNTDYTGHEDLLDADGVLRLPIGSFVVRGAGAARDGTVLVDAGIGRVKNDWFEGGLLLDALAAAGVALDEIDAVVCSHLHLDHCGWLISEEDGSAVFPNAQVWAGAGDWRLFVEERDGLMREHVHAGLQALAERGRVSLVDGDASVMPGVSTMAAPGHTPGHVAIVLSSGEERALLLGDAISCPVQLDETDWAAMSDVDPALARRTRERLWQELEGEHTVGAGAHFPGLQFGRVLRGDGRRWWS
jgi:glyoxylase-like metal-dependent hydrolase (beta-lactamase superfamily II)